MTKAKKILETGEMTKDDIEEGGDWYEVRLAMEEVARDAGFEIKVIPFDQNQGPEGMILSGPNEGKSLFMIGGDDWYDDSDWDSQEDFKFISGEDYGDIAFTVLDRTKYAQNYKEERPKLTSIKNEESFSRKILNRLREGTEYLKGQIEPGSPEERLLKLARQYFLISANPKHSMRAKILSDQLDQLLRTSDIDIDVASGIIDQASSESSKNFRFGAQKFDGQAGRNFNYNKKR